MSEHPVVAVILYKAVCKDDPSIAEEGARPSLEMLESTPPVTVESRVSFGKKRATVESPSTRIFALGCNA